MNIPPITSELIAEAKKFPNGYVYVINKIYSDPDGIPGAAIVGAWKVDINGNIEGIFIPNPNYRERVN